MIRLIATDLDGTLLRHDKTVSPWTRSVLDAAREMGIHVVPVTARQPRGITAIAEGAGLAGWAIAVNGALAYHLGTGEVGFEHLVQPEAITAVTDGLLARCPGTHFAAVVRGGERFCMDEGYRALASPTDHQPAITDATICSLAELAAEPVLKLIARHPDISSAQLVAEVGALGIGGVHFTWSGADFIEGAAGGVTKATGLADLCQRLGIEASEVAAFGDGHNDVEMLRWAGHSFAMADADEVVKAAAKGIAGSNMDDGVGRLVMAILRDPTAW